MGKAVQHIHSLTNFMNGQSIILLVKEKAGFLPFLHINDIFYAVFHNLHLGIKGFAEEALPRLHALLPAHLRITAFIHAADMDAVLQHSFDEQAQNRFLHAVNPHRKRLYHKHIGEFIHNQTGQKIRFPENNTAGGNIHRPFAVIPCRLYSGAQKCLINHRILISAHHTNGDFGIVIIKACPHGIAVKILHRNQLAIDRILRHCGNFIIEYPKTARLKHTPFALFQCCNR